MQPTQQTEALASVKPRPTKKAIIEAAVEMARRQHEAELEALTQQIQEVKDRVTTGFYAAIAADPANFRVALSTYREEFECVPLQPLPPKLAADYSTYQKLLSKGTCFDNAKVRKVVTENLNGADKAHADMVKRLLDTPSTAAALSELLPGGKPTLLLA